MTKSLAPFKTELSRIENLLQKITATQDTTQRCDHARQINEHRPKAASTLLEFRRKYKGDLTHIELCALNAPMAYIAFNINTIVMEPYKKKLNTKYTIQDLMARTHDIIYITEQ